MALPPVAMDTLYEGTVTFVPGPATSDTLGIPVIISTDPLDGSSRYLEFTSAQEVADALAATYISASTAGQATAAFAQTLAPATLAVVRYDTGASEAPSDGLEAAIGLGLDVGPFMLNSTVEATQNTLALWLAADSERAARYPMIIQSADTGLYGGSKPVALAGAEQPGIRMIYSADAAYTSGAYLGVLSGVNLRQGPTAAKARILTIATATLTAAQRNSLFTNDVSALLPLDYGASATQRILMGEKAYDGTGWSGAVSAIYASRELRAVMAALWLEYAITARPIPADQRGIDLASAAADGVLGPLAAVGHWTPVAAAPRGYLIEGSIQTSGDDKIILLDITVYVALEAHSISVPLICREV